jgi:hypothetical protein
VLGGHIELDEAGNTFLGVTYHPNERPLQLTKDQLLQLPAIVESFNGFYGHHGEYMLENQNRILGALVAVVVALLVALVFAIRAVVRWRRRIRQRESPA